MLVGQVMTHNPVLIMTDVPVTEAQRIMRREKIHRLPIVNEKKKLVGIVSEKDLLYVAPSPATTLNVYEVSNLLSNLKVEDIMSGNVISVDEDTPIEEAARMMTDNNIGGLPVVRDERIIGIITESDIFKLFIEIFGSRQRGWRVSALIPETQGELARLGAAIAEAGGNIISLGTFLGEDMSNAWLIMKVEKISKEALTKSITPFVQKITDIREI
ncbi:MAG: CBS domain-containing protein [Spirochaetales bacterium]|nr:CBS domain-containing protein [Spirochaetales bacterium]